VPPGRAAADSRYGGKPVELLGTVEAVLMPRGDVEFPTLRLEGETCGGVGVDCLFPRAAAEGLTAVQPGQRVTVEGTCNGRHRDRGGRFYLRIDNCRLVDTTGQSP